MSFESASDSCKTAGAGLAPISSGAPREEAANIAHFGLAKSQGARRALAGSSRTPLPRAECRAHQLSPRGLAQDVDAPEALAFESGADDACIRRACRLAGPRSHRIGFGRADSVWRDRLSGRPLSESSP